MPRRILTLLCGLLLLLPLAVGADSGGGSDTSTTPRTDSKQAAADYDAGYRLLKAGDYQAAIKAFKRVIKADAKHAMAYNNMAYSYRKLGNYRRAVKLYTKALEIDPNLPEAHEYMGEALVVLGKIAAAKQHLAILEKLDPKLAEDLRAEIDRHERS
jgi:tetratricopeptide (TPR) repeat protein